MKNFEFQITTNIIFGNDVLTRVGELSLKHCDGNKALVLYGSERIVKQGLYQEIVDSLTEYGIEAIPFGGIMENPILATVEEAISVVREQEIGLILAVGGGSVIDSAKAIALGSRYDGAVWDLYAGKAKAESALPIGVVLTMAATASEANGVSVIWNKEINVKKALTEKLSCPAFALMNPELTCSVPAKTTASGAIDIFAHAFERYIEKSEEGTLRNHLCEAVMNTIIEELPLTLKEPESYEHRSQLMWAATVAHSNMVGFRGDYACHALSHVLTAEYGLAHGIGLGMLMPAWCRYMLEVDPDGIQKLFDHVWIDGVDEFEAFIRACGCPVSLREAGIADSEIDIDKLVEKAIPASDGFIGGGYRRLYRDDVRAVLESMRQAGGSGYCLTGI